MSGHTYALPRIASTCGTSPTAPIYRYNQGSLSNGKAPSVRWYFFKFSAIITFSSGFFCNLLCAAVGLFLSDNGGTWFPEINFDVFDYSG